MALRSSRHHPAAAAAAAAAVALIDTVSSTTRPYHSPCRPHPAHWAARGHGARDPSLGQTGSAMPVDVNKGSTVGWYQSILVATHCTAPIGCLL